MNSEELLRRLTGLIATMELAKKMRTDIGLFNMLDALDEQLRGLVDAVDNTGETAPQQETIK